MIKKIACEEKMLVSGGCCNCYDVYRDKVRGYDNWDFDYAGWDYCSYNCCIKNDYMYYAFDRKLYSCRGSVKVNMPEPCPDNVDKYLRQDNVHRGFRKSRIV